jgi:uncharacterized repeat protein (TIGR01451 family)
VDNWRIPINNATYFNVSTKDDPNVVLGDTTGKFKDTVTLNATFKDDGGYGISGLFVSFHVNGVFIGSNLTDSNGFVTYEYHVASAGNLIYTVIYDHAGSTNPLFVNYNPITLNSWLHFIKLNTTIVNINSVIGKSGTPIGLNATIIDENGDYVENVILYFNLINGTVMFSAGSNSVGYARGDYTFPVSGIYNYYVYFEGNGNFSTTNSSIYNTFGIAEISPVVNLTITKTVNTTDVLFNQEISYTITVTNHGPDNATGVVVRDVLDSRLIFISSNSNRTGANYNH